MIGMLFMGAESMTLIGMPQPIMTSLRGIGRAMAALEAQRKGETDAG